MQGTVYDQDTKYPELFFDPQGKGAVLAGSGQAAGGVSGTGRRPWWKVWR